MSACLKVPLRSIGTSALNSTTTLSLKRQQQSTLAVAQLLRTSNRQQRQQHQLLSPAFINTRVQIQRLSTSAALKMPMTEYNKPVATIDASLAPRLPAQSLSLFQAKKAKQLTFEEIGKALGRDEVAVAALFYGQAQATEEDVANLSKLLDLDGDALKDQMYGLPDRGRTMEMPPKEPLIYRLYEIVQNYGYAYKAVLNEKFGDGIMSAISFSTKVEKEEDDKGTWVKITLRGKWLPYTRF